MSIAMARSAARQQLALVAAVTVVLILVGSVLPMLITEAGVGHIAAVLRYSEAAILFGAASLGLLSGRWAARTSVGFACGALLVLAFAGAVSATSDAQSGILPVLSTSAAALAVVLLFAAAAAPEVSDTASLRRLLIRESGPVALLALVALTPVMKAVLMAGTAMPVAARMLLSALVAAGWLGAGIQIFKLDKPRLVWLPDVLVILSIAAVVRAFIGGRWSGSLLIALALEALAGIFALVGAAMATRAAFVTSTDGMTSMLQDLTAMQDDDSRRRAEESERLHEVRSVLAGLRAAAGSLRKYEDSLDPGVRRRLEDAVGAELSRLNQLIDPSTTDVAEALDLEAVVMPVVVAQREQGLVVTTDLAEVSVRGRSAEVATLVSDLLVNARIHALGSAVRLTALVDDGVVTLAVRDWGPGLSETEASHVFERSYRGARSIASGVPGSGLGLHNARKLARRMQGDLQLRAPDGGGCCFIATLPVVPKADDSLLAALEADWSSDRSQLIEAFPRDDAQAHQRIDGQDEDLPLSW